MWNAEQISWVAPGGKNEGSGEAVIDFRLIQLRSLGTVQSTNRRMGRRDTIFLRVLSSWFLHKGEPDKTRSGFHTIPHARWLYLLTTPRHQWTGIIPSGNLDSQKLWHWSHSKLIEDPRFRLSTQKNFVEPHYVIHTVVSMVDRDGKGNAISTKRCWMKEAH